MLYEQFSASQDLIVGHDFLLAGNSFQSSDQKNTVKPRYNAGRGRKNFEAKTRVIARFCVTARFPFGRVCHDKTSKCREVKLF